MTAAPYKVQLNAQPEPICATEQRFCLPQPVTLRIREKFLSVSGDDFSIKCALTGTQYFKCDGAYFSLRQKKVLRDNEGVPVLNLKENLNPVTITNNFNIYAGDKSARKLFKLRTKFGFLKLKIKVDFQDICTKKPRKVVLKGSKISRDAVIYLGEPKQGGVPIGRVRSSITVGRILGGTDCYFLEVAAGVDIALLVAMCIGWDETRER